MINVFDWFNFILHNLGPNNLIHAMVTKGRLVSPISVTFTCYTGLIRTVFFYLVQQIGCIFDQKSLTWGKTKILHKRFEIQKYNEKQIVMHTRFLLTELGIFSEICKTKKKVMDKNQKWMSSIFD